jgi:formate hydrogenlyase transcriptional activator
MVKRNEFRNDLYRLNVFPISVPPLRERREDIRQLVLHFVAVFARRMGKHIEKIPETTMDVFSAYLWPGNVRELQNMIESAVIQSDNGVLPNPFSTAQANTIPPIAKSDEVWNSGHAPVFTENFTDHAGTATEAAVDLASLAASRGRLRDREAAPILQTLRAAGGMIGGPHGAAVRLGLKRTTLLSKMKRLGIFQPRQRPMSKFDQGSELRFEASLGT